MTWKELRDKISHMTEEEQQHEIIIWGDDFSLRNKCLLTNTNDAVYNNSEWDEPYEENELYPSDLSNPGTYKVCEKGAYYILV